MSPYRNLNSFGLSKGETVAVAVGGTLIGLFVFLLALAARIGIIALIVWAVVVVLQHTGVIG